MDDADHDIIPICEPVPGGNQQLFDVVGPVCESGDTFAKGRSLPEMPAGDLVAFRSAGAHGAAMASEYNSRPLIPEEFVNAGRFAVIRNQPTHQEMILRDLLPDWP